MDEHVPDGLPILAAGRHRSPASGSCVMEYASVLAGERWSDRPRCTDLALAELARRVNDDVRREARPALALLAPGLVGAVGPRVAADVVIAAVARVGLEIAPRDLILLRIQRRAQARLTRGAGRLRARGLRWGRAVTGAGLGDTYLQLGRVIAHRPRAERDGLRIRALAAATGDVRRQLSAPASAMVDSGAGGHVMVRAST
ncbi:hypothetical protein [Actinomycetospora sp.]|jgi:hypothetical protein|uniref:hypothetical protein n=1 Tax=Actinomycetospora sp. TaxID=1872135 RepID=UPI002F42E4E7